jgi:hypothetical protein
MTNDKTANQRSKIFFGNQAETFLVAGGRVFVIQSPDLRPKEEFTEIKKLPKGAKALSEIALEGIEVPEALRGLI